MDNEVMMPQDLIEKIRKIMNTARYNVAREVNKEQLLSYWNIGRVIVEHEQNNNERAEYGRQTLKQLSCQRKAGRKDPPHRGPRAAPHARRTVHDP